MNALDQCFKSLVQNSQDLESRDRGLSLTVYLSESNTVPSFSLRAEEGHCPSPLVPQYLCPSLFSASYETASVCLFY